MTPDDRTRALDTTATNLAWLTDEYRTFDTAITITLDIKTKITIAAGATDQPGSHPKGSHSDPTGVAAAGDRISDLTETAERTVAQLNHQVTEIAHTADFIHATVARALHDLEPPTGPATLHQALADITWTTTEPHTANRAHHTYRTLNRAAEAHELDDAIDRLALTVAQLRADVTRILHKATRPTSQPKPKQKRRQNCEHCATYGYDVPTNGGKTRCDRCIAFRTKHGFPPDEKICRLWFFHPKRAPSRGMIEEARAAAQPRRKRVTGATR